MHELNDTPQGDVVIPSRLIDTPLSTICIFINIVYYTAGLIIMRGVLTQLAISAEVKAISDSVAVHGSETNPFRSCK